MSILESFGLEPVSDDEVYIIGHQPCILGGDGPSLEIRYVPAWERSPIEIAEGLGPHDFGVSVLTVEEALADRWLVDFRDANALWFRGLLQRMADGVEITLEEIAAEYQLRNGRQIQTLTQRIRSRGESGITHYRTRRGQV